MLFDRNLGGLYSEELTSLEAADSSFDDPSPKEVSAGAGGACVLTAASNVDLSALRMVSTMALFLMNRKVGMALTPY